MKITHCKKMRVSLTHRNAPIQLIENAHMEPIIENGEVVGLEGEHLNCEEVEICLLLLQANFVQDAYVYYENEDGTRGRWYIDTTEQEVIDQKMVPVYCVEDMAPYIKHALVKAGYPARSVWDD